MSLWKVMIIVAAGSLILFTGTMFYLLYPRIRNVSEHEELAPQVGKELVLTRKGYLYEMPEGKYRFKPLLLSSDSNYPFDIKLTLPVGYTIVINEFRTFTSTTGNTFTDLYAIGTTTIPTGDKLEFEYDWGNIKTSPQLRLAPWQDSSDKPLYVRIE